MRTVVVKGQTLQFPDSFTDQQIDAVVQRDFFGPDRSLSQQASQRHAELQGQGGINPESGLPTYENTGVAHEFFTSTPLGNIATGVAKGVGSTAYHLGELVKALVPGVHTDKGPNDITQALEPSNTTQRVAKGAEQVGEFFLPGAAEAGALAPAAKAIGKLGLAGEALTSGATGGGVAAAQGDNPLVGAVAGAASPVVAKGLVGTAKAFLNGLVGASPAAFAGGANPGLSMVEEKVMGATKGGFLQGIRDAQSRTMAKLNSVLSTSPMVNDIRSAINDPIDEALKSAAAYPDQAKMLANLKAMITSEATSQASSGSLSKVSAPELNTIRSAVDDVRIAGVGDQGVPPAVSKALLNVSRNLNTMLDDAAPGSRFLNHQYGNLREGEKMFVQKVARGNSQTGNLALQTAVATVPAIHDLSQGNYAQAAKKAGITFALERGLTSPAIVSTAAQGMAHLAAPAVKAFAPGIASVLLGGNDSEQGDQPQSAGTESAVQPPPDTRTTFDRGRQGAEFPKDPNANDENNLTWDTNPAKLLPERFTNARNITFAEPLHSMPVDSTDRGLFGYEFDPKKRAMQSGPVNTALIDRSANDQPGTWTHELGHAIYTEDLSDNEKAAFQSHFAQTVGDFVSKAHGLHGQDLQRVAARYPKAIIDNYVRYGRADPQRAYNEAFAELAGQYMVNPSAFRAAHPATYALIKQDFGGKEYVRK